MPPRILNLSPSHSLAAWLGLLLALAIMGSGGAMAESTEAIQAHDRAVLFSLGGERRVTLPHRLAADDFPPNGGLVRYRIEVDLNARPREPLGIFVRKLSLSGQVILNGETIGACGLGDLKNLRCLHQPQLFVPPVSLWRAGINVLEFDIYANDRQMNGLSPVQVGSAQALGEGPYRRQWLWQVELLRALTWVVVTLGGLALVVSRMLREEPLYGWFGLCALFNALGNLNILVTDPPVGFEWFSWFVFSSRMVTVPLLLLMLLAAFDRAGGVAARGLVIYALLMPVGAWISGNNRWAVAALYLPGLLTGLVLLAGMIRWTWRSGKRLHRIVTALTSVLVLASIADWLRLSGRSDFEGVYWATYVLSGFFLVFGLALMSRLVAAMMAERRLSDWLRLASRAAKAGFWDWNLATDRVRWSREMRELFGVTAEPPATDLETWSLWRSRVHPEDLPVAERQAAAAARDRTPLALDYRILLPSGDTRWIETRADISPATAGRTATLAGISLDVTERRQVEADLRESEARFRTLFERLPVAYQSLDIEGHWLKANDKMAELLGFDRPESMLGLCFGDYWEEDRSDEFPVTFGQLKDRVQIGGDLHLRRRDGASVTAQISGYVQRDLQGRFQRTHCVLIDVTERRALEAEILAMNASLEHRVQERTAQLQAANQAKSQFLANMSHEIRTPMNAVLGLAQILEREPLAAEHREMIQRIRAAGRSLLGIINDILDFSKIEAGQLELDRQDFALAKVLEHLDDLLGPSAQAKGLTLMIEPPSPQGRLCGDSLRLEQILINLTGNAIKFTTQGEVSIRVRPLELTATTARLRFEVRDTGIGLNAEARDKLFRPFTQADSGISRRFGGTGLGLSISKRLVELMGGEIGVESEPGRGSTFWFELPFGRTAEEEAPSANRAVAASPAQGPRLSGLRVLGVDDNHVNLIVLERALKLEGASIELAADGQQALQTLVAQPRGFDVVLMDIQMPVMDGLTATRAIRANPALTALPIIALTAGVLAQEREATLVAGVNDFLAKPLDIEEMVAKLQGYAPGHEADTPSPPAGRLPSTLTAAAAGNGAFPVIAGIDHVRVARLLGHDRAHFLRLLGLFVEEFQTLPEQLQADLDRDDRATAIRRAHTLKGSAGNLGIMDLMHAAATLETALHEDTADLAAPLEHLGGELAALIEACAPWLNDAPAVAADTPAPPLDPAQLAALRQALRQHDLAAIQVHAQLEPALASVCDAPTRKALARAIGHLRFDEALQLLEGRQP